MLAQIRPGLDAVALKGVLVGTASPTPLSRTAAQGAGVVDAAAASAAEVIADPSTVSFGAADKPGWKAVRRIAVRNVSTRRVTVDVAAAVEGIAGVSILAKPTRLRLPPGARSVVTLTARVSFIPRRLGAIEGRTRLDVSGGGGIFVPWAVTLPGRSSALIGGLTLSARSFRASDRAPAVLTVQAGQVRDRAGRRQLRALSQLDVELWRGGERLGLLARLRDVLPGRYAFGLTGRGAAGWPARSRPVSSPRGCATPRRSRRIEEHRLPNSVVRQPLPG